MLQDSLGQVRGSQAVSLGQPDAVSNLMRRMTDEYGVPFGQDDDGLRRKLAEWREVLGGYEADQLRKAGSEWIRLRNSWPKASDIRTTIHAAMPLRDRPSTPTYRAEPPPKHSPEAQERVRRMMAILERNKLTEDFPFSATILDPEYQRIEDEMGVQRSVDRMPDWWWREINKSTPHPTGERE